MAMHCAMQRTGQPTINDVARVAGVSKKTVSRVINRSPLLGEETRARVEAVIADLGYIPNPQARALALSGEHEHALARFEQHQAQHGGGHRSNYWRGEALAAAGHAEAAGEAFRAAAADPKRKLPAEENWFRALARVKSWRFGGKA